MSSFFFLVLLSFLLDLRKSGLASAFLVGHHPTTSRRVASVPLKVPFLSALDQQEENSSHGKDDGSQPEKPETDTTTNALVEKEALQDRDAPQSNDDAFWDPN